uniref:Ig-like domain-containing protein n=1 Tax=Pygocentrus nattereri TaxID=42514 RepID=A0A3B4CK54_PYGNA
MRNTNQSVNTDPAVSVINSRVSESLTILCLYDEKYKSNRKYWCRGYLFSSCKIVASTNTSGRTSVTDHPTQNMFTVELKSLQDSDSGHYWCAVEIGGRGTPDDKDYLYLTVSAGKKSLCVRLNCVSHWSELLSLTRLISRNSQNLSQLLFCFSFE